MIRSGLVNTHKGSGFEQGYPHQRDNTPRDEIVRPYVDGFDTGMGEPSNMSVIVPKPVAYTDIFSKKATPDERLYLLGMVQKGVSQMASAMNRGRPKLESAPLPGPGKPPTTPPGGMAPIPPPGDMPSGMPPSEPDTYEPDTYEPIDDELPEYSEGSIPPYTQADELGAVDVVFGTVHQPTFTEQENALAEWIQSDFDNRMRNLIPKKHVHNDDDVTYPTNFDSRYDLLKPARHGFRKSFNADTEFQALLDSMPSVPKVSEAEIDALIAQMPNVPHGLTDDEMDALIAQMPNVPPGATDAEMDALIAQMPNVPLKPFVQSVPGGYPKEKIRVLKKILKAKRYAPYSLDMKPKPQTEIVKREVQAEIKVNGIGPRSRTIVRKRGTPAPVDTIKRYLGPRYSQKPGPKKASRIAETVREMNRPDVDMNVDMPPRRRNPLGLTVDTSITKIDKQVPKVRKSKINSKMEDQIPDVKKKATLRKRK